MIEVSQQMIAIDDANNNQPEYELLEHHLCFVMVPGQAINHVIFARETDSVDRRVELRVDVVECEWIGLDTTNEQRKWKNRRLQT